MTLATSRLKHRQNVMRSTGRDTRLDKKKEALKHKWKQKKDKLGRVTWYRWNPNKLNSHGLTTGLGFWEKVK